MDWYKISERVPTMGIPTLLGRFEPDGSFDVDYIITGAHRGEVVVWDTLGVLPIIGDELWCYAHVDDYGWDNINDNTPDNDRFALVKRVKRGETRIDYVFIEDGGDYDDDEVIYSGNSMGESIKDDGFAHWRYASPIPSYIHIGRKWRACYKCQGRAHCDC